ncbi:hypothetical protein E4K72_10500 [Oxalobacteraceae bacterium OM1]|nr:hypothetical protein E4K72_10500 [Oxalobacteraceae bacterium OM1]
MTHVLIVITVLGGSAWGPVVSMAAFASAARCDAARIKVLQAIDDVNRTNPLGGTARRQIVSAQCVRQ